MFTGIVTDIGVLQELISLNQGLQLKISTLYDVNNISIGSSIACNGVCLTLVKKAPNLLIVEAWSEALELTTIKNWVIGEAINLEQSLCLGDELGGHLVYGHVDDKAEIIDKNTEGDAIRFRIKAPNHLKIFIAPKGSIALDGTSLTVNKVNDNIFDVLLIAHSLKVTNWKNKNIGDFVNIEVDSLARYYLHYQEMKNQHE